MMKSTAEKAAQELRAAAAVLSRIDYGTVQYLISRKWIDVPSPVTLEEIADALLEMAAEEE